MKYLDVVMPDVFVFVNGLTSQEDMDREKKAFIEKKRKGVVATTVWSEGINIRSVGAVINAAGGESEIATIQKFGRGMRTSEGKIDVVLIDLFDMHNITLMKHSGKRICQYIRWGWL